MTLAQRYQDLTEPLTMFGKTYPAQLAELTVESLQEYAKRLASSDIPLVKSVGQEINCNLFKSGYNLNGNINH